MKIRKYLCDPVEFQSELLIWLPKEGDDEEQVEYVLSPIGVGHHKRRRKITEWKSLLFLLRWMQSIRPSRQSHVQWRLFFSSFTKIHASLIHPVIAKQKWGRQKKNERKKILFVRQIDSCHMILSKIWIPNTHLHNEWRMRERKTLSEEIRFFALAIWMSIIWVFEIRTEANQTKPNRAKWIFKLFRHTHVIHV